MEIEAFAGTPNWHAARRGLLTASRIKDALSVLKNGKPSESRQKLMFELLAERMTGFAVENYVTPAMQWGIDQQANAISEYEAITGELVGPEIFVLHPTIDWSGATPDGLVGPNGLIEVKAPTTPKHLAWCVARGIPAEHRMQMVFQIACTRRKWVDFVSFDPRVKGSSRILIIRFEPTPEEIAEVELGAERFLAELSAMSEQVEST